MEETHHELELTKKERRERKRQEKDQQREQYASKKKREKMLKWVGSLLFLAAVIAGVAWIAIFGGEALPGIAVDIQGRDHISPGEEHPEYSSTPPTSGWHTSAVEWGEHGSSVAPENQIHNLEHGGVIIHYQPERIEHLDELRTLFEDLNSKKTKLILMPNENIETTYALTSWGRLDTFDDYDAERIRTYVNRLYNTGPERTQE